MIKVILTIAQQQLLFEAKAFSLEGNRLTIELPEASIKLKNVPVMYKVPEVQETIFAEPKAPVVEQSRNNAPRKRINFCRNFPGKVCKSCGETYTATHNCQKYCQKCKQAKADSKSKPFIKKEQEIKRNVQKPKNPIPDPNDGLSTKQLREKYYGHFDDKENDKMILDPMGLKQKD